MKELNNVLPRGRKLSQVEWEKWEEVHKVKAMALVSLFQHSRIEPFQDLNISKGFDIHQSKTFKSKDEIYQLYLFEFTIRCINSKGIVKVTIIVGVDVKTNNSEPKVFGISKPQSFTKDKSTAWIRNPNNWYHLDL